MWRGGSGESIAAGFRAQGELEGSVMASTLFLAVPSKMLAKGFSPFTSVHARPDSLPPTVARVEHSVSIDCRHLVTCRCASRRIRGEGVEGDGLRRLAWEQELPGGSLLRAENREAKCVSLTVAIRCVLERVPACRRHRLRRGNRYRIRWGSSGHFGASAPSAWYCTTRARG